VGGKPESMMQDFPRIGRLLQLQVEITGFFATVHINVAFVHCTNIIA
jgi:hypothetical protein